MYVTPVSEMIFLDEKMSYVGFEPGAPLTANDEISQPTVNVRAV